MLTDRVQLKCGPVQLESITIKSSVIISGFANTPKFGVFYAKIVQMTFPEVMDHHNYFVYPSR